MRNSPYEPPSVFGAGLDQKVEQVLEARDAALRFAFDEMARAQASARNMVVMQDGKERSIEEAFKRDSLGPGEVRMFHGAYGASRAIRGWVPMNGKNGTKDMNSSMQSRLPLGAPDKADPGVEESLTTGDAVRVMGVDECSPGGESIQGSVDTTTMIFMMRL